jgi:hypothetical protein
MAIAGVTMERRIAMKCRNLFRLSSACVASGLAFFALAAVLSAPACSAQDAARAVRLSSVEGKVRISQGDQVLAEPALANTPLFEGTQVATSDDGRAEIQFEDGSVVRISPGSALTLAVLRQQGDSTDSEIVVQSGLVYFELQGESDAGQLRVRFGDSVVTADGLSVLRVNLDNPPGELAVFSGSAHLVRGSALALDLHGGESVALDGAGPSRYNLAESVEPNSWDTWNSDRDQAMTAEAAARTDASASLGNNNPAWSDLDVSGNWYNVPEQGYIWSPYEAASAGWDPYGNGHWMFTPRFGYIWISGYGWGYTTFQCGAWNYYDSFGWGWAPGMGGCQPWWGGGSYAYNIGYAPPGYSLPRPPAWHGAGGRLPGGGEGGRWNRPRPMIAVDRRPPGGTGGLPSRGKASPVVIGGHRVEPLRSLSARPVYDRANSGANSGTGAGSNAVFSSHPQPVSRGTGTTNAPSRPAYSVFGGSGTGNSTAPRPNPGVARPDVVRPGYVPAPGVYPGGGQRAPVPSHTYSGGAPAFSHSSGGSAPAPSHPSGGGGGGAPAPSHSSGGGGGGGGGSHSSGGGGGGGGSHSSGGGPHH